MSQKNRILIIIAIIVVIAIILALLGQFQNQEPVSTAEPEPGMIHIYLDGDFLANVVPDEITALPTTSFKDTEEGKTQEGPWLQDVILLYVPDKALDPDTTIAVSGIRSSNGGEKLAALTWAQITSPDNHVIFDFASSGTSVKLVSTLPDLDTRDEWIQGVQRIEIISHP